VELLKRASKDLPPDSQTVRLHSSPSCSRLIRQLQILPLYAGLPSSAQNKIFAPLPPSTRRIVVATNIAETSITIPGVVYVIDTGYKKEKEYVHRSSGAIEQLRKRGVSKAAAWQRTGRAGREVSLPFLFLILPAPPILLLIPKFLLLSLISAHSYRPLSGSPLLLARSGT
jgi:HrpA-like RNA helicase